VTDQQVAAHPDAAVSAEFTELASDERIAKAAAALERNGIRSLLAATGADARSLVGSLLTDGAEIYNNTSQTLEAIGVADDIERSGRYQPLRLRLYRMDREMQRREMRTLAASPDYVVGSVHALTEDGSLLIASASGSQLGPLVSGAGRVILVIGAQKIVSDVATGMRRIYEYCYPLEDARARQAYGVPSGVNNILIINKVITADRVTAIIVSERILVWAIAASRAESYGGPNGRSSTDSPQLELSALQRSNMDTSDKWFRLDNHRRPIWGQGVASSNLCNQSSQARHHDGGLSCLTRAAFIRPPGLASRSAGTHPRR
jgi:LUD domain